MSGVTPEQQLLRNADNTIESLELKLSEYATIIQTTSMDLYNCQKARREENTTYNNSLLEAQQGHQECSLAYHTLYQQYQQMMQDFHNLVTSKLQLQEELAALRDSNQNIKTEKMGQTSPKEQGLVEAGLAVFTSPFNSHKPPSANFSTKDRSTQQWRIQKKRSSDGDEGLAFGKEKGQVKKPRRTRQSKPKGTDN